MAAQKKYPDELRERAVKMLFEVRERALAFGCESVLARVPRGVLGSGDVAWLLLRCWAGFCGGRFVTVRHDVARCE